MIRISKEQIKEIAEDLDIGMIYFINKETGALVTHPDSDSWDGFNEELWGDITNEIIEKAYATHYLDHNRINEIKEINRAVSSGQRTTVAGIEIP